MAELIYRPYESGRIAKPDRIDAALTHYITSYFLQQDPEARVNGRHDGSWSNKQNKPKIVLTGEVSEHLLAKKGLDRDLSNLIAEHYNGLNHTKYSPEDFIIINDYKPQATILATNGNAGDTGSGMAVAVKGTPLNLPFERYLAVEIRKLVDGIYHNDGKVPKELAAPTGVFQLPGMRADGKIQVGAIFQGEDLYGIKNIVLAVNHERILPVEQLRDNMGKVVSKYVENILEENGYKNALKTDLLVNPLGAWTDSGGWEVDDGSSEAKPHEDYFGNRGNMDDAPWGEDWRKMSGLAAIHAFHIGKQVVNADLADAAYVVLEYEIGKPEFTTLNITTNGTANVSQKEIYDWVSKNVPLDFKTIVDAYDLKNPEVYHKIASNVDLFHDSSYAWQDLDAFDEKKNLKKAV